MGTCRQRFARATPLSVRAIGPGRYIPVRPAHGTLRALARSGAAATGRRVDVVPGATSAGGRRRNRRTPFREPGRCSPASGPPVEPHALLEAASRPHPVDVQEGCDDAEQCSRGSEKQSLAGPLRVARLTCRHDTEAVPVIVASDVVKNRPSALTGARSLLSASRSRVRNPSPDKAIEAIASTFTESSSSSRAGGSPSMVLEESPLSLTSTSLSQSNQSHLPFGAVQEARIFAF